GKFDTASVGEELKAIPGVSSILPFREAMVLVSTPEGRVSTLRLMVLPRDFAERDPGFARELGIDDSVFSGSGGIVAGAEAARSLGLHRGETLTLLLPSASLEEGVGVDRLDLRLSATFSSGFWQFDSGLALLPEDSFPPSLSKQAGWAPILGIKLRNRYSDAVFAEIVSQRLAALGIHDLRVESWRDYNRAFFGALGTEKGMMFLLLGLVFLVVAINIHHAMRRIVAMRSEDIAILRSLGASEGDLAAVFAWNGLTTGIAGAFVGLLVGSFISVNINELISGGAQALSAISALLSRLVPSLPAPLPLDSVFYLQELPVRFELPETILVAFLAMASALLASVSASRELSRLRPAEILRHE
ncbi:MAG TPA: FtsX-like permease family protein, partial [Rectinemataceae bacterium]|nr:FtsX-like permease family protein [Rectinemataceae bacterium]